MEIPSPDKYIKPYNINGEVWQVKEVKRMPNGFKDILGLCDRPNRVILLRKNLPNLVKWSTFVHELAHAHDFDEKESNTIEHMVVQLFSTL